MLNKEELLEGEIVEYEKERLILLFPEEDSEEQTYINEEKISNPKYDSNPEIFAKRRWRVLVCEPSPFKQKTFVQCTRTLRYSLGIQKTSMDDDEEGSPKQDISVDTKDTTYDDSFKRVDSFIYNSF